MARGRHTVRWVGLGLLLLIAVAALYKLFAQVAEIGPGQHGSQLLLPVLSLAVVVLALGMAGMLIRYFVTLVVDRKRGVLGARLRTKLVFFVLAMVLLPALILFSGSVQIIKQTVEAILRTPFEDLTRQSREIVDQWNEYFRAESARSAEQLAGEFAGRDLLRANSERLEVELDQLRQREQLEMVRISANGRALASSAGSLGGGVAPQLEKLDQLVAGLAREAADGRRSFSRIDHLEDGLVAHAAAPIHAERDPVVVVSVAVIIPRNLADNLLGIDAVDRDYRQMRIQRRGLVRLYITLIGLVFLVTLFVATWIGFYVSRRITDPIQELAAAAREISAGNLQVRVTTEAGDEMGVLIEAFNEMAGELQENREVITRSTADLRRSNRALDERRRYTETLLANLSTAVISLDPTGRVTTANPAAREILGINLAIGDDARRILRVHGLESLAELLEPARVLRAEDSRHDLTLELKHGPKSVSVQVSSLGGAQDENPGTLLMVEDLTEFVRAQKAAAWREIAQRIAHEIKNPLTPIQLAAERLRKKFSSGATDLDKVLPESTAAIEREVAALKRLVDEFSRFARMPEVVPQSVEFAQVVESVLGLYRGLAAIRWELSLAPDLGQVRLDPEQMRRVLINLIDNAVAAMSGEGTIAVRAEMRPGRILRIEVEDSGPGIAPEDRDKMFSPYFSTKKRGTGLGLAIVHKVVTDHQGTIRVGEIEHGAKFIIELPV